MRITMAWTILIIKMCFVRTIFVSKKKIMTGQLFPFVLTCNHIFSVSCRTQETNKTQCVSIKDADRPGLFNHSVLRHRHWESIGNCRTVYNWGERSRINALCPTRMKWEKCDGTPRHISADILNTTLRRSLFYGSGVYILAVT